MLEAETYEYRSKEKDPVDHGRLWSHYGLRRTILSTQCDTLLVMT